MGQLLRSEIEEISDILDETIAKGMRPKGKIELYEENIAKALSHDPFNPQTYKPEMSYHNPYKEIADGSFMPYDSRYFEDQGLDPEGYRTNREFYEKYVPERRVETQDFVEAAINKLKWLKRSLEEGDLIKAGAVPIGTVHTYKDGMKYKKTGESEWKPVVDPRPKHAKEEPTKQKAKPQDPKQEKHVAGIEQHASSYSRIEGALKNKKAHRETADTARKQAVKETLGHVRHAIGKMFDGPAPKEMDKHFDQAERLSGISGTAKQYIETEPPPPHYEKKRAKLHEKILDQYLNKVKPSKDPVAILIGGGSGSGKSSIIEEAKKKMKRDLVHVDADDLKKELPEYDEKVKSGDDEAASFVHDESSDLSSELIRKSVEEKKPFLYDSTMANTKKFESMVDHLHEQGYKVHVFYADLPQEEAMARAEKRAASSGRKVPKEVIERTHANAPKTLGALHGKVASTSVYSTATPKPELKYHAAESDKKHVDAGYLKEMRSRGHIIKAQPKATDGDKLVQKFKQIFESATADSNEDVHDWSNDGVSFDEYPRAEEAKEEKPGKKKPEPKKVEKKK